MRPFSLKKFLFIACGLISLGLGILGVFLPLLPTTPFLLLSAWLFARSSSTYYQRLLQHKWLGSYIRSYREDKAIPLRTKIIAITLLWSTILYSVVFALSVCWMRLVLLLIAIGVSWHLLSFKTKYKPKDVTQKTPKV
ncbi:MAG: YbaN family protein [Bacteroidales bacterium]